MLGQCLTPAILNRMRAQNTSVKVPLAKIGLKDCAPEIKALGSEGHRTRHRSYPFSRQVVSISGSLDVATNRGATVSAEVASGGAGMRPSN